MLFIVHCLTSDLIFIFSFVLAVILFVSLKFQFCNIFFIFLLAYFLNLLAPYAQGKSYVASKLISILFSVTLYEYFSCYWWHSFLTSRWRRRELANVMGLSKGGQKHLAMCKMQCALQKWVHPLTFSLTVLAEEQLLLAAVPVAQRREETEVTA